MKNFIVNLEFGQGCSDFLLELNSGRVCTGCGQKDCDNHPQFDPCPECGRHMEYVGCRWTDCPSNK